MLKEKKRWSELSPVTRAVIVKLAVLDVGLKCWALADLVNRPQGQVRFEGCLGDCAHPLGLRGCAAGHLPRLGPAARLTRPSLAARARFGSGNPDLQAW